MALRDHRRGRDDCCYRTNSSSVLDRVGRSNTMGATQRGTRPIAEWHCLAKNVTGYHYGQVSSYSKMT